jgi:hypothetical protein
MIIATHGIIASQLAGFDADAQAFFDRVTTAGGTLSATEKTAINTLVLDLKGYSIWTKMKAIYPMVGASSAACAQNLKSSSFTGSFSSGWTFASTGVKGNGTSAYMDTNLTPSSTLSQNSTHISYYSRTNNANKFEFEIGSFNISASGLGSTSFGISYASPSNSFRLRVSTATPTTSYTVTDTRGFFVGNRTASNQQKIYKTGVLVDTSNINSDGLSSLQIALNANRISSSSLGDYSSKECSFATIGDGLTDTEAGNFYTAVNAFQTTLARQV